MSKWEEEESQDPVPVFAESVRSYVNLVEDVDKYSAHAFLRRCAFLLSHIYSLGLLVSEFTSIDPGDPNKITTSAEETRRHSEEHAYLMNKLDSLLGKNAAYNVVFDPFAEEDSVTNTIGNDLSDIYQDLREPLQDYESDNEERRQHAIWQWKFTLQCHAGQHIVHALSAIHWLIYLYMDPDPHEAVH